MNLENLQKVLEGSGFEVVRGDGVIQVARETGNGAVEITIDSGGGCLVVKKQKVKVENGKLKFKGNEIPVVSEKLSTKTFRVQLESENDVTLLYSDI